MSRRLLPLLALAFLAAPARAAGDRDAAGVEFFEKEIRPLLAAHCRECHGGKKVKGGLRLTGRAEVLRGGDSGPAVVPGKPDASLLVRAARYSDDALRMPPKGKLPDADMAKLARWVELGAPWPEAQATATLSGGKYVITDEQRRFWAFRPVAAGPPPRVKDATWPPGDLDRFVLARLEENGLQPAPAAGKRALLRRATFDLTGLPPTPSEVDAFLADDSPDAFAKVVDRLLASPAYGERWGRHWLDVVRYADARDARGIGGNEDITEAWRYRDWVVGAFNRDLPYDRFVVEQIAGDRLPPAEPGGVNADGLVATGLLTVGEWGTGDADKDKMMTDIVDDQVNVVSRAFLGLTVACARCHDHKFDPISQADYYGLAGIFFSTHILPDPGPKTNGSPMLRTPLLSAAERAKRDDYARRVRGLESGLKRATVRHYAAQAKALLPQTARYVLAARDYARRPAAAAGQTAADFAASNGLRAYALRQWLDYLGEGDYRPLGTAVRDVAGKPGVHSWRGAADCPNVLVNTTAREERLATFVLPPRSTAVHPGPASGVVVAWQSPAAGVVKLSGRLTDLDPPGGDGVAWRVDLRPGGGARRELASGEFTNGGGQGLEQGRSADRLAAVAVKPGDRVELVVFPKKDYVCDTTRVELRVAAAGGTAWDLAGDLMADPLAGNPHADSHGHAGVWHFLDTADSRPAAGGANPALAAWRQAAAAAGGDRAALEKAADAFAQAFTCVDAASPFWVNRPEDESALPADARGELARLRGELDTLRRSPPPPVPVALAAQEGGVPNSIHAGTHDARIHVRGGYTRLGEVVPRHFPVVLAGENQPAITSGSGRLELAKWVADAKNPLTARVMVNRIWQHHFGAGIVRTPGNFGKLGERPTHPELLDWLADRFVRSGWSVKAMHQLMMLSATYRQGGAADAESLRRDPDNRWFGRVAPRRLDAEEVRDALLAAAGRLDRTPGGPAFPDVVTPRRTVYLRTVRSDRSGFRTLFDAADPESSIDVRTVSTVAPQALFLLNNPFALEQAKALAGRLRAEKTSDDAERVGRAYVLLYGRPPTAEETKVGVRFLTRRGPATDAAWEEYAQLLLCANEFIYVD